MVVMSFYKLFYDEATSIEEGKKMKVFNGTEKSKLSGIPVEKKTR